MIAYLIRCALSPKVYIGITRRSIKARWTDHLEHMRGGRPSKLYAAMRKHGIENFSIEAVASAVRLHDLFDLERQLVAQYDSYSHGYNMTVGGDGPAGMIYSDEARERMRERQTGKKASPETSAKMSAIRKGIKLGPRSDEVRARMSAAQQNRSPVSAETRQKMRDAMAGREFSADHRAKISAARRGQAIGPMADDHKRKIAAGVSAWRARQRAERSAK